jgi:hypothetical protein
LRRWKRNLKQNLEELSPGFSLLLLKDSPFKCPCRYLQVAGNPLKLDGNIDILARRRCSDGKVRLSVWELKKPKTFAKAIDQVYIYAIGLIKLLRSSSGQKWFKIFGFNGPIPKRLEIEAVVLVSADQQKKMESTFNLFRESNPFSLNGDTIKFSAAYYNENTYFIDSFKELI